MTRTRLRGAMLVGAAAPLMAAVAMIVMAASSEEPRAAAATGPCGTAHDGLTSEEFEFIGHFNDWRANMGYTSPLEVSGVLNAAASFMAEEIASGRVLGGHIDSYGRSWHPRAMDCGWPLPGGSGEGTSAIVSSQPINVSAYEAVYGGTTQGYSHQGVTYPLSGAHLNYNPSGLPTKCMGVGHAKSQDGRREAWIVYVAQFYSNQPCPQLVTGTPPTSTPTQGTIVSTPTPTASPSPTATPSPTPPVVPTATGLRAIAPQVVSDVTHPAN